ncbi:putative lipoprotein [Streptomyces globisporus]|uniref:Lipoprotein n=1 Tax=Streptomyces globisporus TaxID=1908 RepID=A0ABM9H541_STRGL|nr:MULTISPECIES: metal-dependent phosphohydrolase [Streptomyces]PPA40016.1 metal-dependent phosphohydrolase [Streptomyces griseus]RAN17379.1 metal-dependent phosphohydrolase [Streptomyces badius]AWL86201.1 metal-dependent phosphohydrolase [Streptomyces globisporus]RAN25259.1 metal-dependent phosphohydrolase [Streptomyces badius]UIZ15317.1 metal-dependent phosphohydrolase [Streptomyces sp. R527F]
MRAPYGSGPLAPAVLAVRGAALLLALVALAHTLVHGLAEPGLALVFGLLVAAGELVRRDAAAGEREPAPLAAAGALAYALLGDSAGRPTTHGALQVIAVVVAAQALAAVPRRARGRRTDADRAARRTLTVGFAAVCFQPLYASGQAERWFGDGPWFPLFPLTVLALAALCDAVLAALLARSAARADGPGALPPYGSLLVDEVRALAGIGTAIGATGVVTALGVAVAGPWAPAVLCGPLLLTQVSARRSTAVRTTCGQTMASLARATEIAGYTPPGHARRVAALATAVGRELGLTGPRLTVLEHAALMHDIGQLSLLDPVAGGATARLPAAEQRRIALLGGAVVRRTGAGPEVAAVVEQQADPYREQPLAARIVRTVNAYDDLCGESVGGPLRALEQLRLGTGHDHQPQVVEALGRVLARGGLAPAGAG